MLSLFKALHTSQRAEYHESLLRAASRLVEGIAEHAVREEAGDHSEFQRTLRGLERQLEDAHGDGRETLLIAGQVLQAMSLYNQEITRKHEASKNELRELTSMLTDALEYACKGQERTASGLRGLEKKIEGASKADDLRVIKANLEHCITSVKAEIDRQDREQHEMRSRAEHVVRSAAAAIANATTTDSVTRLPDRTVACAALKHLIESEATDAHVICVRLDTLTVINSNFGYDVGNQCLALVSQSIAKLLQPETRVYRWSGPGLIIVAEGKTAADQLQRGIQRLNLARDGLVVTAGGRSIVVGVALSSVKYDVRQCDDVQSLLERIDDFVSYRVGVQAQAPEAFGVSVPAEKPRAARRTT